MPTVTGQSKVWGSRSSKKRSREARVEEFVEKSGILKVQSRGAKRSS